MEDPKGWGLAHVLGKVAALTCITTRVSLCRSRLLGLSGHLHCWYHLQTHQDAPGNLCQGGSSLSQIQVMQDYSEDACTNS